GDALRLAAIRAVAALPGHGLEKVADAVQLLREGELGGEALPLLESLPDDGWSPTEVTAALDAIAAFARAIHPEQRTRGDVVAALDFGRKLSSRLPEAEARTRRSELRALGGSTILVRTVPHQMLYDRR